MARYTQAWIVTAAKPDLQPLLAERGQLALFERSYADHRARRRGTKERPVQVQECPMSVPTIRKPREKYALHPAVRRWFLTGAIPDRPWAKDNLH